MPTPSEHTNPEQNPKQPGQEGRMPDLAKERLGGSQTAPQSLPPGGHRGDLAPSLGRESFSTGGRNSRQGASTGVEVQIVYQDPALGFVEQVTRHRDGSQFVNIWVNQSFAPPVDAEAREIIALAERRQLPDGPADAVERLADYFDTWEEACDEYRRAWVAEGCPGEGENRLGEFTLPQKYLDAVRAGDELRLAYEKHLAPALDERALELIRRYVAGKLEEEVEERVEYNVMEFLSWKLAFLAELDRQGIRWDDIGKSGDLEQTEPSKGQVGGAGNRNQRDTSRPAHGNKPPNLGQEIPPGAGRATSRPDPFAALEEELRREQVLAEYFNAPQEGPDWEEVYRRIDPTAEPPRDREARTILQLAARKELPEEVNDAVVRLAHYYPEWSEAMGWVGGSRSRPDKDAESRLEKFNLPRIYLDALEEGDRVRRQYESTIAPPVDAKAIELIRKYVAGELPDEAAERINGYADRFLDWELALKAEVKRQGKDWKRFDPNIVSGYF